MGMVVDRHKGPPPSEQDVVARLRAEGLVVGAEGVRCVEVPRPGTS